MVKLNKVFDRYPGLTHKQRKELSRRRVVRALESIPAGIDHQLDIYYALGFLGTENLFADMSQLLSRRNRFDIFISQHPGANGVCQTRRETGIRSRPGEKNSSAGKR